MFIYSVNKYLLSNYLVPHTVLFFQIKKIVGKIDKVIAFLELTLYERVGGENIINQTTNRIISHWKTCYEENIPGTENKNRSMLRWVTEDISEEATFYCNLECKMCRKSSPCINNKKCKGSEVRTSLEYIKNGKESSMAGQTDKRVV